MTPQEPGAGGVIPEWVLMSRVWLELPKPFPLEQFDSVPHHLLLDRVESWTIDWIREAHGSLDAWYLHCAKRAIAESKERGRPTDDAPEERVERMRAMDKTLVPRVLQFELGADLPRSWPRDQPLVGVAYRPEYLIHCDCHEDTQAVADQLNRDLSAPQPDRPRWADDCLAKLGEPDVEPTFLPPEFTIRVGCVSWTEMSQDERVDALEHLESEAFHLLTCVAQDVHRRVRLLKGEVPDTGTIEEPTHSASQAPEPQCVMAEEPDGEGRVTVGDTLGANFQVAYGTAVWALIRALFHHKGECIEVSELAKGIDLIRSRLDSEQGSQAEVLDDSVRFEGSQKRRVRRRSTSYSGNADEKNVELFRALLRKTTGEPAKRWQKRWIHWDRERGMVTFEYRQ